MRQCLRRLAVCSCNLRSECQQIGAINLGADLIQEGHPLLHQDQPIGERASHRKCPAFEGLGKVNLVFISVFLGKSSSLSCPVQSIFGIPAKLVNMGRPDLRACQTEQKIRMSCEFKGLLYVFERLIDISHTPQGEGRPSVTTNSGVLAVLRNQIGVSLRIIRTNSVLARSMARENSP